MKNFVAVALMVLSVSAFGKTVNAAGCTAAYMQDPCSMDGYSIVQTERFVRGKHNWIHDVHYFGEPSKTTRKKRVFHKKKVYKKKRYRYVKRCRTVKVSI